MSALIAKIRVAGPFLGGIGLILTTVLFIYGPGHRAGHSGLNYGTALAIRLVAVVSTAGCVVFGVVALTRGWAYSVFCSAALVLATVLIMANQS